MCILEVLDLFSSQNLLFIIVKYHKGDNVFYTKVWRGALTPNFSTRTYFGYHLFGVLLTIPPWGRESITRSDYNYCRSVQARISLLPLTNLFTFFLFLPRLIPLRGFPNHATPFTSASNVLFVESQYYPCSFGYSSSRSFEASLFSWL